ncbi:hypothetical protein BHU11_09120 [Tannerella sp. oral taxon 808]|nr:hypothetical protein BHU11_09120 [Tannerella sp. oral taxon 808]
MTQRKKEFSYYRLRLASYLKDYHPERLADEAFIRARSDAAAQAYEDAFRQGYPILEAGYIATEVLFAGLHFSPYYTLEQIIENEFANVVPPDRIEAVALRLLQSDTIRETIAKYNPGDDFDGSPEYDQLYAELVGVIVELLEADGVKVLP